MPEQDAGELKPGGVRTYEFTATLPDGSPNAQNALQEASTAVAYSWNATEATRDGSGNRIEVRGTLRATARGHRRTAKIRFDLKRIYTPGAKKVWISIPRGMRNWLRRMPPPKRLRAKLRFTAIGTAGGSNVVKKQIRLRVRRR